jgi:hypothetical protein
LLLLLLLSSPSSSHSDLRGRAALLTIGGAVIAVVTLGLES